MFQSFLGKTRKVVDKNLEKKVAENKLPSVFWRDRTKGASVVSGCTKHGKLAEKEEISFKFCRYNFIYQ